jgi:integrase
VDYIISPGAAQVQALFLRPFFGGIDMPKRKKYPHLPSSFGSIRYLGKNRTNPYAVHPPCTERDNLGFYIRPKALCYVPDWYTGFAVLSAWHAGTYTPGLELTIRQEVTDSVSNLDAFCRRILKDQASSMTYHSGPTFAEVYDLFYEYKFGEHAAKKLSDSARGAMRSAYNQLAALHDRPLTDITLTELQEAVNGIGMSKSTIGNVVGLIKQLYRFAAPRELCEKDLGVYVVTPSTPDEEHAKAFSDSDLVLLWKHQEDPVIRMVLIMCYSGFRVSAYKTIYTDMTDLYFKGGVKTKSSKGRIVPIHDAIIPLVARCQGEYLCGYNPNIFRVKMVAALDQIGLTGFTPHSTRHTFSRLCESYGVNEADRKRMMGHSFGGDITNAVYGHRSLEELRQEINKIKVP